MFRLVCWCALAQASFASERWELQYFHDEDRSSLEIVDLAFPSAQRGLAVGILREEGRPRPVALVTSDGGAKWTTVKLEEIPRSLFFLDDSTGWMATIKGIWHTAESGRSWKKLKGLEGVLRMWFLDANHGFAVGFPKAAWETTDGGKSWTAVKAAAEPNANRDYSAYHWVTFLDPKRGLISGAYSPPRRNQRLPDWMEPERASREVPTLKITLETLDGGATWTPATSPLFGRLESLRTAPDLNGLIVFRFQQGLVAPGEVYRLDLANGKSERVFREKDRLITDCAVFAGKRGFLAGLEPPGRIATLPIPGKLKILQSNDLAAWKEMDVDYRAVAGRAILAGPDADHVWVATDTGMILRLVH